MATTGRYKTREELVDAVLGYYYISGASESQVAKSVKISPSTVSNILKKSHVSVTCTYDNGEKLTVNAPAFRKEDRSVDFERIMSYYQAKNYSGANVIVSVDFEEKA